MEAFASIVKDPLVFYKNVHPDKAVREASKVSAEKFTMFFTDFWLRKDLFNAISQFAIKSKNDGSFDNIEPEAQRYIEKVLEEFEENGINLPEEKRYKVRALQLETSKLGKQAQNNINED